MASGIQKRDFSSLVSNSVSNECRLEVRAAPRSQIFCELISSRKPNYKFERLERQRAKAAKKAARAKAKEEKAVTTASQLTNLSNGTG